LGKFKFNNIMVLIILTFLFNQVNEVWRFAYEGAGDDFGYFLTIDRSGNLIGVGISESTNTNDDIILVKLKPSGELLWLKRFGGSENEAVSGVVVDNENSVYICGASYSPNNNWDYLILKYDSLGNLLWQRTFGASGYDYARGITIDDFFNIYLTGISQSVDGSFVATYKLNKNGEVIWERFHSENNSLANSGEKIIYDGRGNIFITGSTDFSVSGSDILTIKYDTAGNFYWSRVYGTVDKNEWGKVIGIDSSRNVLIAGYDYHPDLGENWIILKYNQNGQRLFQRTYGYPGPDDEPKSIAIDENNNLYLTGFLDLYFVITKLSPTGSIIWERRIDGGWGNKIVYYHNSLYAVGSNNDLLTVKYDKEGNECWRISFNSGNFDEGNDILIKEDGIYVIGTANQNFLIIKYEESSAVKEKAANQKRKKLFDIIGRRFISKKPLRIYFNRGKRLSFY